MVASFGAAGAGFETKIALFHPALASILPYSVYNLRSQLPPSKSLSPHHITSIHSELPSTLSHLNLYTPKPPMATIVLGTQWGDEGEGKLVDILSSSASLCICAQGGNNAGHTVVADGKMLHYHSIPSGLGLANPKCVNLIGAGCVVHVTYLVL